jgi:general secretion pathway protein G
MNARSFPIRSKRDHAFTLVEILIVVVILGILAAIVIPQFSNATQTARENTMKDDLRYLRTQIGCYQAQHDGVAPGVTSDFVSQMTLYTNDAGATQAIGDATHKYGPYLLRMPANPVNGLDAIKLTTDANLASDVDGTTGWIYNSGTQQIIANLPGSDNNGSGTPYSQY